MFSPEPGKVPKRKWEFETEDNFARIKAHMKAKEEECQSIRIYMLKVIQFYVVRFFTAFGKLYFFAHYLVY